MILNFESSAGRLCSDIVIMARMKFSGLHWNTLGMEIWKHQKRMFILIHFTNLQAFYPEPLWDVNPWCRIRVAFGFLSKSNF